MADSRSSLLARAEPVAGEEKTARTRAAQSRKLSYLERSTARRDSALPGVGAESKRPKAIKHGQDGSLETKSLDKGVSEAYTHDPIFKTSRKPEKLLDRKATALAKRAKLRGASASSDAPAQNAKLLAALVLILALGVGFYFAIPEFTRVQNLEIRGMANVNKEEILSRLEITEGTNLVSADLGAMKASILGNPKIANATLRRVFPDTLAIDIAERQPVACVLVTEDYVTKSIAIDEKGIAFAYLENLKTFSTLPVLSGIRFTKFTPGQSLPDYLIPLLGDLAILARESPSVLGAFSEIKIEKISNSEAEILLYPAGKRVPIRMPARLTADTLSSALLVLDILAGRQGAESIYEIDFRTGTIVYKTKEAQAG
jgi:cell division protein FtsQ